MRSGIRRVNADRCGSTEASVRHLSLQPREHVVAGRLAPLRDEPEVVIQAKFADAACLEMLDRFAGSTGTPPAARRGPEII